MTIQLDGDIFLSNVKNQVYATIIANFIVFSHGSNMGYLSPALPLLLSNDTYLSTGPLTNVELSWIGSMHSIGAIIATFICGWLSSIFGAKNAMMILGVPAIVFWLLIIFGDSYHSLLIGRFAVGLTGGSFQSGVVTFVSEISNNNVRGRLGSVSPLARNMGYLVAFIAGAFVKYEYRPYIFIPIPITYLCAAYFLPSTPLHYLKKKELKNAEGALMYYKACNKTIESNNLALKTEFERIKTIEEGRQNTPKIQLKDFYSAAAFRGFVTSIAMAYFPQATGCFLINNYAALFLQQQSDCALSVNISSIFLAVAQIFGGILSTQMADAFGRKQLNFYSLAGAAVGLFTFAIYSYLHHYNYDVSNLMCLPVICLSFVLFVSSAGIAALANTCAIENFPSNIRPVGIVFYSLILNVISFLWGKCFPILLKQIYLHGFLIILAINCCIGLVFIAFTKETKGKSIDTMESTNKTTNLSNKV